MCQEGNDETVQGLTFTTKHGQTRLRCHSTPFVIRDCKSVNYMLPTLVTDSRLALTDSRQRWATLVSKLTVNSRFTFSRTVMDATRRVCRETCIVFRFSSRYSQTTNGVGSRSVSRIPLRSATTADCNNEQRSKGRSARLIAYLDIHSLPQQTLTIIRDYRPLVLSGIAIFPSSIDTRSNLSILFHRSSAHDKP